MSLDDEGRGNPTSVIFGSNRSGKRVSSWCLAAANRVYMLSTLVKRMKREVPVNKGVTILKPTKKSNKQIGIRSGGEGKRSGVLT